MKTTHIPPVEEISKYVRVPAGGAFLLGDLQVPELAEMLVVFAYDFGRCRNHPRTRHVARVMRDKGIGTLLCDLMTEEEEAEDEVTGKYRHDAEFLARRLVAVTRWALENHDTRHLRLAYFGACTGGAAVLIAAAKMRSKVHAIVVRGGRLDLAVKASPHVHCPTLLIVGEKDTVGIELSCETLGLLGGAKELVVVPGASHLFGEPGALEDMAQVAAEWLHNLDHADRSA